MDNGPKWNHGGISVHKELKPQYHAAIVKLKSRRPFASVSEIIVEAVLKMAAHDEEGGVSSTQQNAKSSNNGNL